MGETASLIETLGRFRKNLSLYAAACLTIRNKNAQFQYLELNKPQRIVNSKLETQLEETGRIRAIILKARQEGVSTLVAARNFRAIHLWSGISSLIVADELDRAEKIFAMYERFRDNLPPEIKPGDKSGQRGKYIAFKHDSELSVRPASDAAAGRAATIQRLHASELAFWGSTARETWVSLMNAIPRMGSEVVVESTANGVGGLFHELWEEAANSDKGEWLAIFLPWWILDEYEMDVDDDLATSITSDPDNFEKQALEEGFAYEGEIYKLSLRKLAWRRAIIAEVFGGDAFKPSGEPLRRFQQEYPATAEEAFLATGSCFFDEEKLRLMARHLGKDEPIRGLLSKTDGGIKLDINVRGGIRLYESPDELGHYVLGVDTAEGKLVAARRSENTADAEKGGRDFSSALVLRLPYSDKDKVFHPAVVVAELHGRLAPEVFSQQLDLLGRFFSCGGPADGTYQNMALIGVERSHSSGQTVLRLIREHYKYKNLYWHRQINHLTKKIGSKIGWVTDATSRMPMLDDLAEMVRSGSVDIRSRDLVREMMTFIVWDDGKPAAQEGTHDDRVIALAIAVQMMREHRHTRTGGLPTYEPRFDQSTVT